MRAAIILIACLAFAGCSVRMAGNQSTSGGTTTTGAATGGSAEFSGGKVAFSSGRVPPPGAPGGHLKLSGEAAVVLVGLVILSDLLSYLRGDSAPNPLPPDERISETCSCYQKPVNGEP